MCGKANTAGFVALIRERSFVGCVIQIIWNYDSYLRNLFTARNREQFKSDFCKVKLRHCVFRVHILSIHMKWITEHYLHGEFMLNSLKHLLSSKGGLMSNILMV